MDLKSYTLEELEPYLLRLYSDPGSILPVSPLRLHSYLDNPRAKKSDRVLFEMRSKGELVAYRSLLPDWFYDRKGEAQRFAWLSGNWVRPDMRRMGYSTKLLEMAEEQWQGRLMYTNYAPESRAVYDRTGRFKELEKREGLRFYLRSATEELLGKRIGSRQLLHGTDLLINKLREQHLQNFHYPKLQTTCQVEQVHQFDTNLSELIERLSQQSLFRRNTAIFKWALENPWITEQAEYPLLYHFSSYARRFENLIYHFMHPGGKGQGMLWLLLHNNVLTVPYLFAEHEELYPCMAESLVRVMIDHGCSHTTIRNPELMENLIVYKKAFLSIRKMPQVIFVHENIAGLIPEQPLIQDGDGDVMFTG